MPDAGETENGGPRNRMLEGGLLQGGCGMNEKKVKMMLKLMREYAAYLNRGADPDSPVDPLNQEPGLAEVVQLISRQAERRLP